MSTAPRVPPRLTAHVLIFWCADLTTTLRTTPRTSTAPLSRIRTGISSPTLSTHRRRDRCAPRIFYLIYKRPCIIIAPLVLCPPHDPHARCTRAHDSLSGHLTHRRRAPGLYILPPSLYLPTHCGCAPSAPAFARALPLYFGHHFLICRCAGAPVLCTTFPSVVIFVVCCCMYPEIQAG